MQKYSAFGAQWTNTQLPSKQVFGSAPSNWECYADKLWITSLKSIKSKYATYFTDSVMALAASRPTFRCFYCIVIFSHFPWSSYLHVLQLMTFTYSASTSLFARTLPHAKYNPASTCSICNCTQHPTPSSHVTVSRLQNTLIIRVQGLHRQNAQSLTCWRNIYSSVLTQ